MLRQLSSQRRQASTQAFIMASVSDEAHSSAQRRQASAHARHDSTINELWRPIRVADKVQNAAQSITICAILAWWALPSAASRMQ
jgi:hypothetical protein